MTLMLELPNGRCLWLGCLKAANALRLLRENGIKCLFQCHYAARDKQPRLHSGLWYPWQVKKYKGLWPMCMNNVSEYNQIEPFTDGLLLLDDCLTGTGKYSGSALVFCLRGANRSALFMIGYMLAKYTLPPQWATWNDRKIVNEMFHRAHSLRELVDIREPKDKFRVKPIDFLIQNMVAIRHSLHKRRMKMPQLIRAHKCESYYLSLMEEHFRPAPKRLPKRRQAHSEAHL